MRPFTLTEAANFASKLSANYAAAYTRRLMRRSWRAIASDLGLPACAVRKMVREAHADLVRYSNWFKPRSENLSPPEELVLTG